jgi:hypothetical protein
LRSRLGPGEESENWLRRIGQSNSLDRSQIDNDFASDPTYGVF